MDVDSELLAIKAALAKERGDHDDNTCKAHEQKAKQDEQHTNFFEELFGFREIEPGSHLAEPKRVRSMVRVDPQKAHLHFPNGRSFGIGKFRIYTLGELRAWYAKARERGDVKEKSGFHLVKHYAPVQVLHTMPEYEDAIFMVASQFNCLEFAAPNVIPEQGISCYQYDRTQGPSCAIMAAAATFYRNYLHMVDGKNLGQTKERQLSNLRDVLRHVLKCDIKEKLDAIDDLLRNGYTRDQSKSDSQPSSLINEITDKYDSLDDKSRNAALEKLRIGIQENVEVTLPIGFYQSGLPASNATKSECDRAEKHIDAKKPSVTQIFASAMSLGFYEPRWLQSYRSGTKSGPRTNAPLYKDVLDAQYEAAFLYALKTGKTLVLTLVGGGAFANFDPETYGERVYAEASIARCLKKFKDFKMNVVLNHYARDPASWKKCKVENLT
eukprot:CAMPEP_0184480832 /NCGR_PEP_ID=MMETSP0113_2-20130426/2335_1 /TAXON_ID=91329 /ORGANISM="Norrisiella sphaerica, Strain BC52" /LENGTH=438 /DNA_ID=CAMNT_0026859561 /DNA_START=192 /DNA_END=1504 /DNA_ORIENTATION=-